MPLAPPTAAQRLAGRHVDFVPGGVNDVDVGLDVLVTFVTVIVFLFLMLIVIVMMILFSLVLKLMAPGRSSS